MADDYWMRQFYESASDLVESYNLDRSLLMQARADKAPVPRDTDLNYKLRRQAQARLFTLPQGRDLLDQAESMRRTLDNVRYAFESPENDWNLALHAQRQAIDEFQAATRDIIEDAGSG